MSGSLHAIEGDHDAALAAWDQSCERFRACQAHHFTAYPQLAIHAANASRAELARIDAELGARGIINPARWVGLFLT